MVRQSPSDLTTGRTSALRLSSGISASASAERRLLFKGQHHGETGGQRRLKVSPSFTFCSHFGCEGQQRMGSELVRFYTLSSV
ncbi:hypothetical protein AMELA_G00146660 [Ameiurus melas]|uniref:Uncharacterized protein n=1 Tax=Ameiurus melas TaxID=219545 RepID=A0A7J6AIW0_AMEME|nr:hypothetical protein AMELA_G00146660 [Ameiurus melas]